MVLKHSNCSANSGATMRVRAFRHELEHHRPDHNTLIKVIRNIPVSRPADGPPWTVDIAKQFVDDGLFDRKLTVAPTAWSTWHSDVTYSLNKRKRWRLEHEVHTAFDEDLAQEPFKITYVKRESPLVFHHSWPQRGDVVAYYDSRCAQDPVLSSKRYSYRSDLLQKAKTRNAAPAVQRKRRRQFHNQHFRGVQRKCKIQRTRNTNAEPRNENVEENIQEIRYDVTVARPLSAQNLKKKCTKYWSSSRRQLHCRATRRRRLQWDHIDSLAADDCSADLEEEACAYDAWDADLEEYCACPSQQYSLLDFAMKIHRASHHQSCETLQFSAPVHAATGAVNSTATTINPASHQRVKKHGKGEAIFLVEKNEEGNSREDFVFVTDVADSSQDSGLGSDADSDLGKYNSANIYCPLDLDAEFTQFDKTFTTCKIPVSDLCDDSAINSLEPADTSTVNSTTGCKLKGVKKFGRAVEIGNCVPLTLVFSLHDAVNTQSNSGVRSGMEDDDADWRLVCQVVHADIHSTDFIGAVSVNVRLCGNIDDEMVTVANTQLKQSIECAAFSSFTSLDGLLLHAYSVVTALHSHARQETDEEQKREDPSRYVISTYVSLPHEKYVGSAAVCSLQEAYRQLPTSRTAVDEVSSSVFTQFTVDDACTSCFTEYEEMSVPGAALSVCVTMTTCRHTFCRRCWQHHLVYGMQSGRTTHYCMEYKCQTAVDRATVTSLVPDRVQAKWQQRVQNVAVEASGKYKWCPNAKCGRLATADKSGKTGDVSGVPVDCHCRHQWCLDCGLEPHWPVSCQQYLTYTKMLQQNGDEDGVKSSYSVISFVNVKRCPGCQYPLEKNGGCSHMTCSQCSKSYCWVCLANWEQHMTGNWTGCSEKKEETVELDNNKVYPLPIECYKKAVEHRYIWKQMGRRWQCKAATYNSVFTFIRQSNVHSVHLTEDSLTCAIDALQFLKLAHILIELTFVLLSNMPRSNRSAKRLRGELGMLQFICNRISQFLERPHARVLQLASELRGTVDLGNTIISHICRCAHRLRSRVKATDQEWLLRGDMEKHARYK